MATTRVGRMQRQRAVTRRPRKAPVVPGGVPAWVPGVCEYLSELIAQKVSQVLVDELRSTEIFARPPAFLAPTSDGQVYDVQGVDVNLPNVGAGGPWTVITTFTMPGRQTGVIAQIANDLTQVAAWANVQWRITVSGMALPGYNGRLGQWGTLLVPFKQLLGQIDRNSIINIEARNTGFGGPLLGAARMVGWYWLVKEFSPSKYKNALKD
jgi:hypothetical protein